MSPAPPDPVRAGDRPAPSSSACCGRPPPWPGQPDATLTPGSDEHVRWFTEAALLWPDFAQAGGRVLVDSHSSGTLRRFEPDLRGDPAERAALRTALQRCFGWDSAELARLESALASRMSNLRLKQAIDRPAAPRGGPPPPGTPRAGRPGPGAVPPPVRAAAPARRATSPSP